MSRTRTFLVTGGGGFLGRAIVERLVARGDRVRSLSRGNYPELSAIGVECIRADIGDAESVHRACGGCDAVFHVAARAGIWGSYASFHAANIVGTQNVIAGCRTANVRALIYTSSPSVVFDGRDMEGVDESVPYPAKYRAHYPRTKALAERAILAANGSPTAARRPLLTVALRPHLIWGPRDNHLVPRIIARASRLRRIGRENKLVDATYIDNAADAHMLAADRLLGQESGGDQRTEGSRDSESEPRPEGRGGGDRGAALPPGPLPSGRGSDAQFKLQNPKSPQFPAGRAYFISNGDPRPLWDIVNAILAAADRPPVTRTIPRAAARAAGAAFEAIYTLLRLSGEPPMTRFLADELSTAHWFDISAAQRDFGYAPRVTMDEGLGRLASWLAEQRARSRRPSEPTTPVAE